MRSTPAASVLCFLLFGIICDTKKVHSHPKVIKRQSGQTPEEVTTLMEDIQKVINQIHFLSGQYEHMRGFSNTGERFSLDSYHNMLTNLISLVPPLLRGRFLDALPKILVCILSGKQDCGLEAELTKTVSVELVKPLLMLLSSPALQTCSTQRRNAESLNSGAGESDASESSGFQQTIINILQSLPLSGNLVDTLSSVMDTAVDNVLKLSVLLLQTPMEYIKIALQFGIGVPSLEDKDTCEEGDLKQLIMWGINHNVSWSFAPSLVDIFFEVFLEPEQPLCTHEGLDCTPSVSFKRSLSEAILDNPDILLKCDRHNLTKFNDTLCADVLQGSSPGSSASVLTLCQALGSLNPNQLKQAWSNMCYVIQMLVSPVVGASSHCSDGDVQDSTAMTAASESPHREAREAPNLRQLACNYDAWLETRLVETQFVSLCSDNDREEFVKRVCSNADLMKTLLLDPRNSWLYAYCANFSADSDYLVSHFCDYRQWLDQHTMPASTDLMEFCMNLDGSRLTSLVCEDRELLLFLLLHPELHFMPNCTFLPSAPSPSAAQQEFCHHLQWHEPTHITPDDLKYCASLDEYGFTQIICSNSTFKNILLQNEDHLWLKDLCNTSLASLFYEASQSLNIKWCEYKKWEERQVDISVVALCWQNDRPAFLSNICCNTSLLDKLLQDHHNQWLESACTDTDNTHMLLKVCNYTAWLNPTIVDMTDVAFCADLDKHNFISKVCTNETMFYNLLGNQDNIWLIHHCANYSNSDIFKPGFKPAEQCQYSSWSMSLPGVALLALCWEKDRNNFVSSLCSNNDLLHKLSQEPYSAWVSSMCTTFNNYTFETTTTSSTTTASTTTTTTTTPESDSCLARNLMKQFHFNCSVDLSSACEPGASQNLVLKVMMHCWVESLEARVEDLLTAPGAALMEQALSTMVVILLVMEEVQGPSLPITKNIRYSMLNTVNQYMKREDSFEKKKVLLQCFGTVLTMMQIPRVSDRHTSSVIEEYFNIPLSSLKSVLSNVPVNTVRVILQYYSLNKDTLQLPDEYLPTMMSVLLQTHVAKDESFFPDLVPLLASADLTDIQAFPSLQDNKIVMDAINTNLPLMTLEQREAFGSWYSKAMTPSQILEGNESLITETGDLIAYLPFRIFKHFSRAQLMNGLDVLLRNNLTSVKQEFIVHSLIRSLTTQDLIRLGKMLCLADPKDLLLHKNNTAFTVILDIVMSCTHEGIILPNHLISSVLLNSTEFKDPSSLSADRLVDLAHLLPLMGVTFLQDLLPSQLLPVLSTLSRVSFSPAQLVELVAPEGTADRQLVFTTLTPEASVILDKLSSITTLTDKLQELGSLIVGMSAETLLTLTSDRLLSSLPTIAQHTPGLSPPQANAIASKLWGFQDVVIWLDKNYVDTLLYCTPLVSVLPRTSKLVSNIENITTNFYNTQQAKLIFREALDTKPNLIQQHFLSLGTLGQGVSCEFLKEYFQTTNSKEAVVKILYFLRQQPRPLHTALKNCVIEELYQLKFFSQLLKHLGAELAMSIPLSMSNKFSADGLDILRKTILQDPHHFLLLPRQKQALLVDKMVQRMGMYTGGFTEEEFRSLGIMAPFVVDDVFIQMDRSFFIDNLNVLLGLCYTKSKMNYVALILQEPAVFGPVKTWNQTTLIQVDRFLFFLSEDSVRDLSPALMTVRNIERLFINQRLWERGDVGASCLKSSERKEFFLKQKFVLQLFLGFLRISHLSPKETVIPTCAILHSIPPAAWPPDSLINMSSTAFSNCLELIGHDLFLESKQQILKKVKEIHGNVSSFNQSVISQLGGLAFHMSVEELSSLQLVDQRSIAALGAVSHWKKQQLTALFTRVLNSTKKSPSQLDSSTLVAMGYIVCGATVAEIKLFNAVEFSKAVLFLGQLMLSCSEEQLDAFVDLLRHSLAFGPTHSWGTDIFIEIGILAAGLSDSDMSSLVKKQIEGITPLAISKITPERFRVSLGPSQISMFSYEQANAVTNAQYKAMSNVQSMALSIVLTPWENRPIDFRGRSRGLTLSHSPLCLTLGLLMLLTVPSGLDLP